ncbi:factor-independent urate hydroxylase [Streptomyces microflavus]|uniref:factor-independent urate hydroxylase n=1 Tax=Streptomyces microflavus TaxID=1919 RepID=UPI00365E47EC
MSSVTGEHDYGKTEINFIAVGRTGGAESLTEVSASVKFSGGFAHAYATGDNASILPTGTMTNTVLAMAPGYLEGPPEAFAAGLADHFVEASPAVETVTIRLAGQPWVQLTPGGVPDPSGFAAGSGERWTAQAIRSRSGRTALAGGIDEVRLAKSTGARFAGFLRDSFTTTPDFHDRLMGAVIGLEWHLADSARDPASIRERARNALLAEFSGHISLSGQQTLHVLGSAVLKACPEVQEVALRCEARDHILADLSAFGAVNLDQIYVAPRNPYSVVHLSLTRGEP